MAQSSSLKTSTPKPNASPPKRSLSKEKLKDKTKSLEDSSDDFWSSFLVSSESNKTLERKTTNKTRDQLVRKKSESSLAKKSIKKSEINKNRSINSNENSEIKVSKTSSLDDTHNDNEKNCDKKLCNETVQEKNILENQKVSDNSNEKDNKQSPSKSKKKAGSTSSKTEQIMKDKHFEDVSLEQDASGIDGKDDKQDSISENIEQFEKESESGNDSSGTGDNFGEKSIDTNEYLQDSQSSLYIESENTSKNQTKHLSTTTLDANNGAGNEESGILQTAVTATQQINDISTEEGSVEKVNESVQCNTGGNNEASSSKNTILKQLENDSKDRPLTSNIESLYCDPGTVKEDLSANGNQDSDLVLPKSDKETKELVVSEVLADERDKQCSGKEPSEDYYDGKFDVEGIIFNAEDILQEEQSIHDNDSMISAILDNRECFANSDHDKSSFHEPVEEQDFKESDESPDSESNADIQQDDAGETVENSNERVEHLLKVSVLYIRLLT